MGELRNRALSNIAGLPMLENRDTTHCDRVSDAICFRKPTRTPRDFAAVPEVWHRLGEYFGTESRKEILERLDVDCRVVSYDMFFQRPNVADDVVDLDASHERSSTSGMWRTVQADGSNRDIWGVKGEMKGNHWGGRRGNQ